MGLSDLTVFAAVIQPITEECIDSVDQHNHGLRRCMLQAITERYSVNISFNGAQNKGRANECMSSWTRTMTA